MRDPASKQLSHERRYRRLSDWWWWWRRCWLCAACCPRRIAIPIDRLGIASFDVLWRMSINICSDDYNCLRWRPGSAADRIAVSMHVVMSTNIKTNGRWQLIWNNVSMYHGCNNMESTRNHIKGSVGLIEFGLGFVAGIHWICFVYFRRHDPIADGVTRKYKQKVWSKAFTASKAVLKFVIQFYEVIGDIKCYEVLCIDADTIYVIKTFVNSITYSSTDTEQN